MMPLRILSSKSLKKGNSANNRNANGSIIMRKQYIKHDNLRKSFEELDIDNGFENLTVEVLERFLNELKHSCLILAADMTSEDMKFRVFEHESKEYGLLFTDMNEFRKSFSDEECESYTYDFELYQKIIEMGLLDGFLINPESEAFILKKEIFNEIKDLPEHSYDKDNSYTTEELKRLNENIDNHELEEFLKDPANIGRYEELFNRMSESTMLTLMLSDIDLSDLMDDGAINMMETGPVAFLYLDEVGGQYATLYTSHDKMNAVNTDLYRYSQIVNVSLMANFVLNDDMDGIIINPGLENIILSRDVLLEHSGLLEKVCNDSRLNSAIFHMFEID